jgi:DNA-binding GntR family transcriptional regulator
MHLTSDVERLAHEQIFDAIAAGDASGAEQAIRYDVASSLPAGSEVASDAHRAD